MINENAIELLKKGYFQEGENKWDDIALRVAKAVAQAEEDNDRGKYEHEFSEAIKGLDFIPSSPCLTNAGTVSNQLSSCFIIDLEDNIESIYNAKAEMAKIFQKNGGAGLNISVLRPTNSTVETSKGFSCGTLGFMEEFNLTADVVTRNNLRKGALKIDLCDWHPDIVEFISCKDDTEKFKFMNISVSISDKFMNAVINDDDWNLEFPDYSWDKVTYNEKWDGDLWSWKNKGYPTVIYKTMKAQELYHIIMKHAWKTGEPGVSFLDTMDRDNPNPHLGKIRATNPCSEFCSIPYNSCNLGSVNLSNVVADGKINYLKLGHLVSIAVRFLDNMITINKLPLKSIDSVTKSVRSIGLGTMGFGDLLYKLRIPYGSDECYALIDDLYQFILNESIDESSTLAESRGCYDEWNGSIWEKQGKKMRNSNLLSIAPNGSIAFIANTSGGLEPNFALCYTRRMHDGTTFNVVNPVFESYLREQGLHSDELIQKIIKNKGSCQGIDEIPDDIQKVFVVASDLTPDQHLNVLTNIQKYVDLSCSKTINLPNSATVEDIQDTYIKAWKNGVKGVTVYRDGSRANQTLSVNSDEELNDVLEDTFELKRGMIINVDDDVIGRKRSLNTGCGMLHCQAFFDPVNGDLLETYLSKGSTGGCNSFMVSLSRLISLAARGGVNIDSIIDQLNSCPPCPSYILKTAKCKNTSRGTSCPMAVGFALKDISEKIQDELGLTDDESEVATPVLESPDSKCPECGGTLCFESGCSTCKSCGMSKCD